MPGTTPAFRTGAEAAKKASKGASFAKTHYLSLDENEEIVVRPITDGHKVITVLQHQMVPTKPAPKDSTGNWPEKMGAVCRMDEAFAGMYDDCFICDHKLERNPKNGKPKGPAARNWMLACVREKIVVDGEEGWRNKKREIQKVDKDGKPTGETFEELDTVVINLGHRNFTGPFLGFAGLYKTLLDRDYWIKREGTEIDTVYRIAPLDPIYVDHPETGEEVVLDLRDPAFMQRYGFKDEDDAFEALVKIVTERSSDEFYARFFDTRVKVSDDGTVTAASSAEQAVAATPAPGNDVDPKRLEELRKRVRKIQPKDEVASNGQADESEPEEHEAEEEPEPEPVPAAPKAASKTRKRATRDLDA
jgi:hypothetical protein